MRTASTCALCRLERSLIKSHIYPKFLYEKIYDNKHFYRVLLTESSGTPSTQHPEGVYERLLCEDCDRRRLGRLDDYAAKVFKGGIDIEITDLPDRLIFGNLDYAIFKLWLLSLLWRCGVTKQIEFKATSLGPHAEILRQMLLTEDPGLPHQYGCTVILPSSHEVIKRMLYPPEPINIDGHKCYRAAFGALWWIFVVSGHSADFPFQEGFLSQQGALCLFKEHKHSGEFLRKLWEKL